MLLPLLLLLNRPPADGIKRFQDFIKRNRAFSVQIKTKSDSVRFPGKGSLVLRQPDSFRLTMDWGAADYTYVKSPAQAVEFERYRKTYQEYPPANGLAYNESVFAGAQADALPVSLLAGDLTQFAPRGTAFNLVSKANGTETYRATWNRPESIGKIVAVLGPDGRLLHFDHFASTPMSRLHRISDFSGYVLNPKITADTFSTVPPLGFTCFQFPYAEPIFTVGEPLHLGTWQSSTGPADVDAAARGKLVIVREKDSEPADALLATLKNEKLPVDFIVLSISATGGQFWSPPPQVGPQLAAFGTPFLILVGPDSKIKAMWLGFDADKPGDLVKAIADAAKEKDG